MAGSTARWAFTLAEVLITLGVIGVVAAMTMPSLIASHQEKVMVVRVKKAYSELQNALKLYAVHNNCNDISCISDVGQTSDQLADKLFTQFSGALRCDAKHDSKSKKSCRSTGIKSKTPYYRDGMTSTSDTLTPYFISANGVAYKVIQYSACPREATYNKYDENGYLIYDADGNPETYQYTATTCAIFYIDANGTNNGPNQFGADIYRFDLDYKGKLSSNYITPVLTKGKLEYTPYQTGQAKK